jgi:2-succinyl-6-hydroxy-2,4-cyclohexadiene-1-carboxylate synthase
VPPERLVLVHGFTQTARSWDGIVERLGDGFEVVAPDAPGHGAAAAVTTDLPGAAEAIVAAGGRATYVGYSMGARMCLHAALARPADVRRLVLVSGTAGIEDASERSARRRSDDALAAEIERDGVDAFLDRWLALPLFATLPRHAGLREDRRRNTAAGLAASLRDAGTGTQEPLWSRLGSMAMPVLLVAGALDAKFVALAERMHGLLARSELVVIDDAGHAVHLERPDAFVAALTSWLARTGPC